MCITNVAELKRLLGRKMIRRRKAIDHAQAFFRWPFCFSIAMQSAMLRQPTGLIWVMAQGHAALIHRQGEVGQVAEAAADRHTPTFPSAPVS